MAPNTRVFLRDDALMVWIDSTTLQLGVDSPLAVFRSPSPTVQRLIVLLHHGVHFIDLRNTAYEQGLSTVGFARFWAMIEPAIHVPEREPEGDDSIVVVDPLLEKPDIAHRFAQLGYRARLGSAGFPTPSEEPVVSVERFFHDTYAQQYWLSGGSPLLPIRFSDRSIHIGPVLTESGPCGNCLNSHLADADPNWKTIASQLIGRPAPTETPPLVTIAVSLGVRALSDRRSTSLSRNRRPAQLQYAVRIDRQGNLAVTTIRQDHRHRLCRHHDLELALAS